MRKDDTLSPRLSDSSVFLEGIINPLKETRYHFSLLYMKDLKGNVCRAGGGGGIHS